MLVSMQPGGYKQAMFAWLGRWIARWPAAFVGVWVALTAAGAAWAIWTGEPPPAEIGSFLPPDSPHNQAQALLSKAFPVVAARTTIVVIACRSPRLTADDLQWLDRVARSAGPATGGMALSPANPILRPRLVSPDEQAALVLVNLSSNFVSPRSIAAVEKVEALTIPGRPAGLAVEITGSGGIGRDYFHATARAFDNTTWVTITAVLLILVVVYRSPVGALVPLVSIGVSVYLALVLMTMLAQIGWVVSDMERVFAVVLLFGAGVDFALFWIARYREELGGGQGFAEAAESASRLTGPAIVAGAAATICGLTTLVTADLVPLRMLGRILGLVLTVSLLAALTLLPAVARLLGRWLFWPMGAQAPPTFGQRLIWPALADQVTRRPRLILLAGTIVLGIPAIMATRLAPRYDSLTQLPPGSSSRRGFDLADTHFPTGVLYPTNLLLKLPDPPGSRDSVEALGAALTERIAGVPGVHDVYSLDAPLGRRGRPKGDSALGDLVRRALDRSGLIERFQVDRLYLSSSPAVLRFEFLIDHMPFTKEAMAVMEQVRTIAEEATATNPVAARPAGVFLAGLTPYIMGVRDISGSDQLRIMLLATAVIALIVLALIRDAPLTVFMVLATWLTFGATLTLSDAFFRTAMGCQGLDYKIRLIVFVIVMAVGQDYNIFLVTRLQQEPAELTDAEASRRAILRTGSVISSCGLIMAATLGSLWAGQLSLLQQAGFALALGILIDTFFVRPLLIPSFFLATGRRRGARWGAGAHPSGPGAAADSTLHRPDRTV